MKARERYEQFDWPGTKMYFTSRFLPESPSAVPSAAGIVVNRVTIESNVLVFHFVWESSTLRFSMPNKDVAEALLTVFSSRLAQEGPLSLQELGDTEIEGTRK